MTHRARRRSWLAALGLALLGLLVLVAGTLLAGRDGGDDDPERAGRPERSTGAGGDHRRGPRPAPPTTPAPTVSPTTAPAPPPAPGPPAPNQEGNDVTAQGRWRPRKGASWQWQLDGGPIDTSVDADVYDVDLFSTPAETIRALHDRGRRVICYFSAGSWEPYRPDAGAYPEEVLGGTVEGWPDERWIDIRRRDVLRPLIAARLDLCREKGADAAEPDWMDSHQQDTGFPITAEDQLAFNRMIAELAHERGLAIGLKNDADQAAQLADLFDFAVVEQCAEFGECEAYRPFLDRGKPVFHAEYDLPTSAFCAESRRLGLSSIRKRLGLDPWRETC